jgi:hypothetical protein
VPVLWAMYRTVVDRMGAQIVEIAEQDPIEPVEPEKVGDIEKARSAFAADRRLPVFNIEVVVPTADAQESRDQAAYGETPAQWRPFGGQELPLAEYARQGVRSLDEFVSLVPVLVAEAERQYFRHRSSRATVPGSPGRPRLGRAEGPDAGTAAKDP